MGVIINETDFEEEGFYRIPSDQYSESGLTEAIALHEEAYLSCLLGVELYQLFKDDLSGQVPQDPIYEDIFNPFITEIDDQVIQSEGMKNMVKGFIYWEVMKDRSYVTKESGNHTMDNENAQNLSSYNNAMVSEKRFNRGRRSAMAIQQFICEYPEVYPTYNGKEFIIKYSAIL